MDLALLLMNGRLVVLLLVRARYVLVLGFALALESTLHERYDLERVSVRFLVVDLTDLLLRLQRCYRVYLLHVIDRFSEVLAAMVSVF